MSEKRRISEKMMVKGDQQRRSNITGVCEK